MSIHRRKLLNQAGVGLAITALIVTACAGSNDPREQPTPNPATTATPIATTQTPSSLPDNAGSDTGINTTSSSALSVSTTSSTTPATASPQTTTVGNTAALRGIAAPYGQALTTLRTSNPVVFDEVLDLIRRTADRPDVIGMSWHSLVVARRR